MKRLLAKDIRKAYLAAYAQLVDCEILPGNSEGIVGISVPLHIVGQSRVEFQLIPLSESELLLSDGGRTIQELQLSGYALTGAFSAKIAAAVEVMGAKLAGHAILLQCGTAVIGATVQRFAEIIKTVGDFYLARRVPVELKRPEVVDRVGRALTEAGSGFELERRLPGRIEAHRVDFFIPRNGAGPWAVEVLGPQQTHSQAMIWDYRCRDIKGVNPGLNVGIIFDDERGSWSDMSRKILKSSADLVVPSSEFGGSIFPVDSGPFRRH